MSCARRCREALPNGGARSQPAGRGPAAPLTLLDLPHILFTVAGLLIVVGLLQPLAVRLNLSRIVLLALVGVLIGVAAGFLLEHAADRRFQRDRRADPRFPDLLERLPVHLPADPPVPGGADDRRPAPHRGRGADPGLAVIAVLATTFTVGFALWPFAGVPLVACLLLASIIATTDPSAVVAIFRDLGAPARLALVEGESLLNDATAIAAIFTVLLDILLTDREVRSARR